MHNEAEDNNKINGSRTKGDIQMKGKAPYRFFHRVHAAEAALLGGALQVFLSKKPWYLPVHHVPAVAVPLDGAPRVFRLMMTCRPRGTRIVE